MLSSHCPALLHIQVTCQIVSERPGPFWRMTAIDGGLRFLRVFRSVKAAISLPDWLHDSSLCIGILGCRSASRQFERPGLFQADLDKNLEILTLSRNDCPYERRWQDHPSDQPIKFICTSVLVECWFGAKLVIADGHPWPYPRSHSELAMNSGPVASFQKRPSPPSRRVKNSLLKKMLPPWF